MLVEGKEPSLRGSRLKVRRTFLGSYGGRERSKKEGRDEQIKKLPAMVLLDKVQIQQETRAMAWVCLQRIKTPWRCSKCSL